MKMSTHITSLLLAAEALFSCKAAPETPTLPYEADPVLRTPAQLRSDALPVGPPGGLHLHSPAAPWFMGLFEKP